MELTPSSVVSITSSVDDDIWHADKSKRAYEWWYFDAISDDGRDAIIIVFLDNFIFSPRNSDPMLSNGGEMVNIRAFETQTRYPAVSFTLIRDGQLLYRAMNEFSEEDLAPTPNAIGYRFGESSFCFETAQYGSGYMLSVVASLGAGRRLKADLEWLSVETDLTPEATVLPPECIGWNVVAPRSDVSGKIEVNEENRDLVESVFFLGTGRHDHVIDDRWLRETETRFHRGAAHFVDATALFGHFDEPADGMAESELILIRDGSMSVMNAWCEEQEIVRDRHGIRHASNLVFTSKEGIRLAVRCTSVLDSSFFYLRMLNDVSLTLEDGSVRTSEGLSELIAPQFQRHRWLDWLANLRRTSRDF